MKQFIHRVHPLCWLALFWLATAWAVLLYNIISYGKYSSPPRAMETPLTTLFSSVLIIIHLGIYEISFRRKQDGTIQALLLAGQMAFVLTLTQFTQDPLVAFTFTLVFLVAAIEILKRFLPIFLASGCILSVMLLYMSTLGWRLGWIYLWRGDSMVIEIPEVLMAVGLLFYLQQRRAHGRTQQLLHDLHTAHQQLSAYALRMEELTTLTERQRLARELHDTLVQGLAGLVMQLDVVNNHLQAQRIERAQAIMPEVIEEARDALMDTRCALGDLRSGGIRPEDLREVLLEEISHFTAMTEITCQVSIEPLSGTPAFYCEHIVRVVGEALANIKRHAQAQHTWIAAWHEQANLLIEIQDDGRGFDPVQASAQAGHYGLLGIRERAKLIGGLLELQSQPGQGTRLRLKLPLSSEGAQEICQVDLSAL